MSAETVRRLRAEGPLSPERERFRLLDDLAIGELPPLTWMVDGVIPASSLAALFAPPESCKSFLALDLALSIATGQAWHGRAVEQGLVAYVASEGSSGLAKRVAAWKTMHGVPVTRRAGVIFATEPVQLLEPASVAAFLLKLETLPERPTLLVLDTLARCMDGGAENDTQDMGSAVNAADVIRRATGATVFLVHHTRLDGERERGSTALRGAMDAMLAIKREAGENRLTVQCEKMKDAPHFASFGLELYPVRSTDSCALVTAMGSLQQRDGNLTASQRSALDALQRSALDDGLAATVWLKVSGAQERTFYAARKALLTMGYVQTTGQGKSARYHVSSAGVEALQP